MDSLPTLFSQTAEEFKILLNRRPMPAIGEKFLQFIIINIFAISYTSNRSEEGNNANVCSSSGDREYRPEANRAAINFGMILIQILVDEVNDILSSTASNARHFLKPENADSDVRKDIRIFLPPIKVLFSFD